MRAVCVCVCAVKVGASKDSNGTGAGKLGSAPRRRHAYVSEELDELHDASRAQDVCASLGELDRHALPIRKRQHAPAPVVQRQDVEHGRARVRLPAVQRAAGALVEDRDLPRRAAAGDPAFLSERATAAALVAVEAEGLVGGWGDRWGGRGSQCEDRSAARVGMCVRQSVSRAMAASNSGKQ